MRRGTPGFVGARLREAREARGFPGTTLAELIGVTRQAISSFENDEKLPAPDTLKRITEVLNLPQSFFLRPIVEDDAGTVFFRSRMSATKTARTRARRRRLWVQQIAAFITKHVDLPPVNFPRCDFPADPMKISDDDIERAATDTRRFWGLKDGLISDVTLLLENNGAILVREPFDEARLDAYSAWVAGVPYIILSADKQSAVRSRLDVAHELGHIILHRNIDDVRLEEHREDFKKTEEQAYLFARKFLLPSQTFANDFIAPTLDALLALKPKWKMSVEAMMMEAKHLGLIAPEQAERLWIAYGRRRWKAHEPLDDDIPIEQPRLLRLAFELALREKVFTPDDVTSALALAKNDVESLVGLNLGTLDELPPAVRVLTPKPSGPDDTPRRGNQTPGGVVQFPSDARRKWRSSMGIETT